MSGGLLRIVAYVYLVVGIIGSVVLGIYYGGDTSQFADCADVVRGEECLGSPVAGIAVAVGLILTVLLPSLTALGVAALLDQDSPTRKPKLFDPGPKRPASKWNPGQYS